jgi:hypothetical protein
VHRKQTRINDLRSRLERRRYAFIASASVFVVLANAGLLTTYSRTGYTRGESENQDGQQDAIHHSAYDYKFNGD